MQGVAKKMAGKGVKGRGRSRLGGTGLLPLSGRRFRGLQQAAVSVHVCVPWPFARGLPQLIPQNSGRLSSETFTFWYVLTPGDAAQNSLGVPSSLAGFPAFPEPVTSAEIPAARWVQERSAPGLQRLRRPHPAPAPRPVERPRPTLARFLPGRTKVPISSRRLSLGCNFRASSCPPLSLIASHTVSFS